MQGKMVPVGMKGCPKVLYYRQVIQLHEQLERYVDRFGSGNIHLSVYDDFKRDTAGTFDTICRFLGIAAVKSIDFKIINANKRIRNRKLARWMTSGLPLPIRLARPVIPASVRRMMVGVTWRMNIAYRERPPLSAAVRDKLTEECAPIVDGIERLSGRDLNAWRRRND
jgi:hypothetical protein